MRLRQILPALALFLLAGGAATGLFLTRDNGAQPARKGAAPAGEVLVDQGPVVTARRMAALASSQEERQFAHDAARLADHEVDLAFADALRRAANLPTPETPAVLALEAEKSRHEAAVDEGQRTITRLSKALATAREQDKDALEDQLEVAKAQLELDKDELDATGEMLEKLGADPGARIRRLKTSFAASEGEAPDQGGVLPGNFQEGSLLHRLAQWSRLRRKGQLLAAARAEALAKGEEISQRQQALGKDVEQEKEDRESIRKAAKGFARGDRGAAEAAGSSRETARATVMTLKHFVEDQRTLADYGKRFQDQRALAETYQAWGALARVDERAALHAVLRSCAWILGVLILIWFSDLIFEGVFRAILAGRKRVGRNLKVVKFAAQTLGVLAIILIILGTPSQLTTLFGLAGAGLTVALKDFIISFFGWFVLVGPKGIHVGDWVEIKGVSGEVVEIGLQRTLLLETGNWSDAGHPTGRVVSFVNSFAMEGHFFNFSSAGQWMWDELTVSAPAGADPYPFIDGIKALVEARTGPNAALAFKEWEQSSRGYQAHGLKAEPGINVVPTASGVEIHVRYVTRAQDRQALRKDLNEAVVEMLHGKRD
jgi:small-conductance mechanosensitive channel